MSEEKGTVQPLSFPRKLLFVVDIFLEVLNPSTDLVTQSGRHPAAILLAVHEDWGGALRTEPGPT